MINEQLTLDDIIAKTLDALEGAGLKNTTLWSYSRHYASLRIFFRQHECRGYDLSLIEAFLAENEERYRMQIPPPQSHLHGKTEPACRSNRATFTEGEPLSMERCYTASQPRREFSTALAARSAGVACGKLPAGSQTSRQRTTSR